MNWISISWVCGLVAVQTCAYGTIPESEPNDSIDSVQLINVGPIFSEVVLGSLVPGDVDYYQLDIAGGLFTATLSDFTPFVADNDPIIALYDSNGFQVAFDDNSGQALAASIFLIPQPGTYFIAVSANPDFDFVGDHSAEFNYHLVMNTTPAPGVISLLAMSWLWTTRRRG